MTPAFGIRATQGHSAPPELGTSYLIASQEELSMADESTLPKYRVHDTSLLNWESISTGSRSLLPRGLEGTQAAIHVAVSLP